MKGLIVALALVMLVSGCASDSSKEQGNGFKIVQTNFLGSLWDESYAKAGIISQDGGQSFEIPGGGLWAFGDTFKGSRSTDLTPHYAGGAVSCSIAFLRQDARHYPPAFDYLASNNVVVSPFAYLTNEPPKNNRLWPGAGIYLNDRYYLFYSLINIYGSGTWDFRGMGSGLARSSVALGNYDRLQPYGDWHFPVEPDCIIAADGWLYLYEIITAHGKEGASLARVRPGKIEDPQAYEFYSGPGPQFSPRKDDEVVLVKNIPGQVSVAWNAYLHKYVMASSSDFSHSRQIRFLVADAPYGPWGKPVASIQVPAHRQGKPVDLVYCAYLHPELFRENGQIMNLTYSLGLKDAGFDANCEMVEIRLKRR